MPEGIVTRAINGFFDVADESGTRLCRARGVFRKKGITVLVGDRVEYDPIGQKDGVITEVHPRTNELIRPPIANIDQALIVFSFVSPDFHPNLVDRILVSVLEKRIHPVIILTKSDLASAQFIDNVVARYQTAGFHVIPVISLFQQGISEVREVITGKVNVMAGPSGAGKSTLANALSPELGLKMGEISEKLGRGKHTTRHVELFELGNNTYVADAPGFSQLELGLHPSELRNYYPEFQDFECPYRGCLHMEEAECAVKEAVADQRLANERYQTYVEILSELRVQEERKYE